MSCKSSNDTKQESQHRETNKQYSAEQVAPDNNLLIRDKQKEYEERTKAKKKAEIEARKQAIRTEDIARGVFIPVSSLPQLGPRKGA